jgi:hypothetical protein
MAAYGWNKQASITLLPILCLIFFIPFVLLAGILGTLTATLAIWLLPSRGRRRTALIVGAAAVIFLFIQLQNEGVKEQGTIAGIMSGYLPNISFAKNPLLPSSWTTRGILSLANIKKKSALENRRRK